jgi:phosphatidylserine/phosphatidylglycerophosphate/cardiolipin synthase-like enzyme
MMDWIYLATGATGALTLVFVFRQALGVLLGGPTARVSFAPTDKPLDILLAAVRGARREVLVRAAEFTVPEVAQALVQAKLRGITVEVLLPPSHERELSSVLPLLLDQGLAPLIDHDPTGMRAQIAIIDGRLVLTGSLPFTPTTESETGDHLLALRDQPGLAASFRRQFFLQRERARPPQLKQRPATTATPTTPTNPTTPPATPPISETLARLLPGLRGVNLPSEADLEDEEAEEQKSA